MRCLKIDKLTTQYQTAVRAYRLAAMELIDRHGDDFMERSREADRLHIMAREVFERIAEHAKKHGCGHQIPNAAD